MQKHPSIKIIADNDLCISCGSCVHICPFDNIVMRYATKRAKWDAVVTDTDICSQCNGEKNCLYVCPSYNTDYTQFGSEKNDFLGNIENVYNGWSKFDNIRFHSSSGGFVRTLAQELLDKKIVTHIISITHDKGLEYTPQGITDVDLMPNSIYHNINYEKAFEIIKTVEGRFVVIGLPCQLTGIEHLLKKRRYAKLKEKIHLKIALICGYTFDRTNMEFFTRMNNIEMEEITYRERGRYRKTRISSKRDSVVFDIYNPKSINEKINNMIMFDRWLPQKQCLYCVDHLGYCADIVVGDAWQRKYNSDKVGTNIIIARTSKGKHVVESLENVHLEDGNIGEITESQHAYAKPFLGLGIAKVNLFKDGFIPRHKVSKEKQKKIDTTISKKDKIKAVYLKKLLRQRYFRVLKALFIILEFKIVFKLSIKKLIGRRI